MLQKNYPIQWRWVATIICTFLLHTTIATAQSSWPAGWQYPVPGQSIMAVFGENLTAYGGEAKHTGIDIGTGTKPNAPILAAGAGIVKLNMNGWVGFQGGNILIFHGWDASNNPITTHYSHVRSERVRVGQVVKKGEVIAIAGGFQPSASTGKPWQPHLHFSCIFTTGDNAGYWGFFDCLKLPQIVKRWDSASASNNDATSTIPQEIEVIEFNVDFVPKGGYVFHEPSGSTAPSTETINNQPIEATANNSGRSKLKLLSIGLILTLISIVGISISGRKKSMF